MSWDEEQINGLYRRYRSSRDGIPWSRYQPIIEAAREVTFEAQAHRHMAAIREKAREMYPERAAAEREEGSVVDLARARQRKARGRESTGVGGRLRQSVRSLTSGLNPAGWVPLAAAAAVLLAVAPVLIDLGNDPGPEFVAERTGWLQGNPAAVSEELGRLGDFQYGFSSSSSEFARSFRAGLLFVDLVSLSADPADPRLSEVVDTLVDGYGEVAGITRPGEMDGDSLNHLVDRLQAYYSDSGQSSVFVFGQWAESSFLLSRLVTPDSTSNLQRALKDAAEVRKLLETGGHLTPEIAADLDTLEAIGTSNAVDAEGLERASLLLLKLRTRYALS